jgi:hypothetical protein
MHALATVIIIITGRRFQANLPPAWETKREKKSTGIVVGKQPKETKQSTCRACTQSSSIHEMCEQVQHIRHEEI